MTSISADDESVADSRRLGSDLGDAKQFRDREGFADRVAALRAGGGSLNLSERTLMVLGGIIAPLGLVIVLLGWAGASRTSNLFEQIPYLISGGLFGLGLVFLGAFFYFAHWMTELVKESRAQSTAMLDAIARLEDAVRAGDDSAAPAALAALAAMPPPTVAPVPAPEAVTAEVPVVDETHADAGAAASSPRRAPLVAAPVADVALVATERGSMAHRTDCVVASGKPNLRTVTAAEGLAPCKLCDPYD